MDNRKTLSGTVRSIHYNVATQELEINYCYSGQYKYRKVPPDVYEELQKSASPDIFINRRIRPKDLGTKILPV